MCSWLLATRLFILHYSLFIIHCDTKYRTFGAKGRNRTGDFHLTMVLLYLLSYNGMYEWDCGCPIICYHHLLEYFFLLFFVFFVWHCLLILLESLIFLLLIHSFLLVHICVILVIRSRLSFLLFYLLLFCNILFLLVFPKDLLLYLN